MLIMEGDLDQAQRELHILQEKAMIKTSTPLNSQISEINSNNTKETLMKSFENPKQVLKTNFPNNQRNQFVSMKIVITLR